MGKSKDNNKITDIEKQVIKSSILVFVLLVLVISFSYIIFNTDILTPNINEVTASYISFNNSNRTDMLKINNLKEMSDKRGKSSLNFQSEKLKITGKKNSKYTVVLYPTREDFDLENIKYYLTDNSNLEESSILSNLKEDKSGGIIVTEGVIDDAKELVLKLWLTDSYSRNHKHISFEIQVKQG